MTDRLEDATPTTVVKRGGSIQPQALGPQKRSNVGSSVASSSQGQNKIFDPKTAPTIIDRLKHAASSSSTEAKKRSARRGRGPELRRRRMQDRPMPRLLTQRGRGEQFRTNHRHQVNSNQVMLLSLSRCYLAGISGRWNDSVERKLEQ
jgi:hypothetical protein